MVTLMNTSRPCLSMNNCTFLHLIADKEGNLAPCFALLSALPKTCVLSISCVWSVTRISRASELRSIFLLDLLCTQAPAFVNPPAPNIRQVYARKCDKRTTIPPPSAKSLFTLERVRKYASRWNRRHDERARLRDRFEICEELSAIWVYGGNDNGWTSFFYGTDYRTNGRSENEDPFHERLYVYSARAKYQQT